MKHSRIHCINNIRNSCFCISSVNALVACSKFSEQLLDPKRFVELKPGKGDVFRALVKICKSKEGDIQCVKSIRTNVAQDYKKRNPTTKINYDDGKQHDPEEFLRALLDCVSNEFMVNHKWVSKITEYVILETHSCPNCDFKKNIDMEENVFQIDANSKSLKEGIKKKLATEEIQKGSDFQHDCPNPTNKVFVRKRLLVTPEVFIPQVNRFEYNKRTKSSRKVKTDVKLSKRLKLGDVPFELDASINHEGNTMNAGHCITNVFDPKTGLFHRCSDSSITKNMTTKEAKANQVYVAFLSKKKSEQEPQEEKIEDENDQENSNDEYETNKSRTFSRPQNQEYHFRKPMDRGFRRKGQVTHI